MNVIFKLELLISATLFHMPNVSLMFYTPAFSHICLYEHWAKTRASGTGAPKLNRKIAVRSQYIFFSFL